MLEFRLSLLHIMEEQSITVIWNQFVSEKSSVHHGWAVINATKHLGLFILHLLLKSLPIKITDIGVWRHQISYSTGAASASSAIFYLLQMIVFVDQPIQLWQCSICFLLFVKQRLWRLVVHWQFCHHLLCLFFTQNNCYHCLTYGLTRLMMAQVYSGCRYFLFNYWIAPLSPSLCL